MNVRSADTPPVQALGQLGLLFTRSMRAVLRRGLSGRELFRQLHELGGRSLWLVVSGLAFFGVVMVTIADGQARRMTGSLALVGPAYFELLIREFGPMVAVLLAASRAGALVAAELAQMTVNEQIEALEMSAGDPLADLVAPRVIASAVAVPALTLLGTVAASLSAAAVAQYAFGTDAWAFLDPRYVDRWDLLSALAKSVACGLFIPLAAAWQGLRAQGGADAVGRATTQGVVTACVGCLFIDLSVAWAMFLLQL